MLENILARYARGLKVHQAEQDNVEMSTQRFAEERNVPVQQIRRVKVGAFPRTVRFTPTEPGHYEYSEHARSSGEQPPAGLRGGVQILDGLKEGETIAAAGNFLIDSQMQLAGNPSLIDPTEAIQKQKQGPLDLGAIHVAHISGKAGEAIEKLYAAYFAMQAAFAADKMPSQESINRLVEAARALSGSKELPNELHRHVERILEAAPHLHHAEPKDFRQQAEKAVAKAKTEAEKKRLKTLWGAREQFRPISHAVVQLASQVRGLESDKPFTHFFCPMVPGGRGDWLQPGAELTNEDLINPYWGSGMLHCGEVVHEFPAEGHGSPGKEK